MGTDKTATSRETWVPATAVVLFTAAVYVLLILISKQDPQKQRPR